MASGLHNLSFSASVAAFCKKAEEAALAVLHESIITAVTQMQMIGPSTAYPSGQGGRNPVDTGWHTSHIEVSFTGMPLINPASNPPPHLQGLGLHVYEWDKERTFGQIREMKLGQTVYIGYTAAYAGYLEYGHGQSSAFVRMVAQRWPMIVDQTVAKVRQRLGL
jgi:hypothetical protein